MANLTSCLKSSKLTSKEKDVVSAEYNRLVKQGLSKADASTVIADVYLSGEQGVVTRLTAERAAFVEQVKARSPAPEATPEPTPEPTAAPEPTVEETPKRPFVLAAPQAAAKVAPSVSPSPSTTGQSALDRQIDKAAASANPEAQLRTLKNELITRRDAAADAGRSTTELTQAINRIDTLAAEGATPTTGVLEADNPQSVWASLMGDDGAGYTNMSEQGRHTWGVEVATSAVRPTKERAEWYQDNYLSEDTQKGISYVRSLASKLDTATDERYLQITEKLGELANSGNPRVAAEAQKALDSGQFSLAGWNTRQGTVNANGTPTTPVASGRVRMIVQNFTSRLMNKPKVTVVANQRELQRTNPALFARANAARSQGDFATAKAAGYSFGDGEVIIFTDRIANEQHLRFVLAHETFGHFGMRGVVPQDRFNALMRNVYETDPSARLSVDAAMETRGLPLPEAVEEYLSDYAALLDTSVVARVWNTIKGFLDRLGIKSGDAMTRYLLDHSRRYVRQGAGGVPFDMEQTLRRIHAVEYGEAGTGRFSPQSAFSANYVANTLIRNFGAYPKNLDEVFAALQKGGKSFADGYNDFKDKFLRLRNFVALENPGQMRFTELMKETNQKSMAVKSLINEYLRPLYDAKPATQDKISRTLYAARMYEAATIKRNQISDEPLFSVAETGELIPNQEVQEKLFKSGLLSLDDIRKGYSYEFSIEGNDGKETTIKQTEEGQSDFSEEDYALYTLARRAIFDTDLELIKAEHASFLANKRLTNKEITTLMRDKTLTPADRRFVDAYARKALALYTANVSTDIQGNTVINPKSMADSEGFLKAVNAAFLGERTDRNDAVRAFFNDDTKAADAFITELMAFKDRRRERDSISETDSFILQNKVKQLILDQHNLNTRDKSLRYGMATGYIPVIREGNYEVRVQAYTLNGTPVEVKDVHKDMLAYSQFGTRDDAETMAELMNGEFGAKSFELLGRDDTGNFVPQTVKLRAETGRTLKQTTADPQLNVQDFLYGVDRFGLNLTPTSMEKIITALTKHGSGARKRLMFSRTPGFNDTDGLKAISQHIEERGSIIAKALVRQPLNELMNLDLAESRALWEGDEARVNALRAELAQLQADPNASEDAKRYTQQQLSQAEYQFRKTNPPGKTRHSEMMRFYNQSAALRDYLDGSKLVDETEFGAGPVASRVRAYTGIWQLGGSLAQGALNLLSPYTNWMPYMASFNAKNGFGGGFGLGKAMAEYHRAFGKIGAPGLATSPRLNDADFYDSGLKPSDPALAKTWKPGIAQDPALQKKFGMTAEEARIVAFEIREGTLQAAQTNALVATARGRVTNKYARQFVDVFMAPFNRSEQAARRSAFLAAYRLKRDQVLAAGKSERQAQEEARDFAVKSIDYTLGDYSVMNRPPAFRAGIQSFLYIYKTYPTTTIQLLANLSWPAQLSMLAGLWFLSGAAGLPFAEDLEDLIDTIAQRAGFRQGSIRAEIIKHIEGTFPGMSALVLKGAVNQWLPIPADVASRTSTGNVFPGTGMALAGANQFREMMDILGPAAGMLTGAAKMATDLLTVPFSSTKTLEDVAREAPITPLRLLGDAYAYMQSGAVVDRRGYVISQEMGMGTLAVRLAGFYPTQAANQYDVIRIAQRQVDYQKEAVAGFRQAWIKATLRGDSQGASDIAAAVSDWNNATRGTPLEIRNFMGGNMRALREAQRPAGERALRASPRAAQEDIRGLVDALTE